MREQITPEKFKDLKFRLRIMIAFVYGQNINDDPYLNDIVREIESKGIERFLTEEDFETSDLKEKYASYEEYDKEYTSKFLKVFKEYQDELLSYDLSNMTYENWKNMPLIVDGELDLSETKGNFDFSFIDVLSNNEKTNILIAKNCNIRNLYKINTNDDDTVLYHNVELKRKNFTGSTFKSDLPNHNAFLFEDISDNFKQIIIREGNFTFDSLSIDDIKSLDTKDMQAILNSELLTKMLNESPKPYFNEKVLDLFFDNKDRREIYNYLLENDMAALDEIINHTYYKKLIETSNNDINLFKQKANEITLDVFCIPILSGNTVDKLRKMKNEIEKLGKIEFFDSFKLDYSNYPEELKTKIENQELTIEDYIKYPNYLDNPLFLAYSNGNVEECFEYFEELYSAFDLYDITGMDSYVEPVLDMWNRFISRCKNYNEMKENVIKQENLFYSLQSANLSEKHFNDFINDKLSNSEYPETAFIDKIFFENDYQDHLYFNPNLPLSFTNKISEFYKDFLKFYFENYSKLHESEEHKFEYIEEIDRYFILILRLIQKEHFINFSLEEANCIVNFLDKINKAHLLDSSLYYIGIEEIIVEFIKNGKIKEISYNEDLAERLNCLSKAGFFEARKLYDIFGTDFIMHLFTDFDIKDEKMVKDLTRLMGYATNIYNSNLRVARNYLIERFEDKNYFDIYNLTLDLIMECFVKDAKIVYHYELFDDDWIKEYTKQRKNLPFPEGVEDFITKVSKDAIFLMDKKYGRQQVDVIKKYLKIRKDYTEENKNKIDKIVFDLLDKLNYINVSFSTTNSGNYYNNPYNASSSVFNEFNKTVNGIIITQLEKGTIYENYKEIKSKLYCLKDMINRIYLSNSSEIRHLKGVLGNYFLTGDKIISFNKEQLMEEFDRIEDIFLRNNIPYVGKIFEVFKVMHPDAYVRRTQSPNLNSKHQKARETIIFSDLLKCALGSNNRSINEYINSIKEGNGLIKKIIAGEKNVQELSEEEKLICNRYNNHLNTLYNSSAFGKIHPRKLKNNILKDSYELISLFLKEEKENFDIDKLPDKIVRMFGHYAGINTLEELEEYRDNKIKTTDARNRERARNNDFSLKKGDYYKGLANQDYKDEFYRFIPDILQNGSLCKEFLGSDARSDTTPLDTDLSRLMDDFDDFSVPFKDRRYAANRYGPLWIVLNDDDRFNYSKETGVYDPNKLEIFDTNRDKDGHYGIRTGFASSDIDYFVVDEERVKLYRIKYMIASNGFYIPVLNTSGKLVFTPEEYDQIRSKMQGLSYYETGDNYEFAKELDGFDIEKEPYDVTIGSTDVIRKRNLIINELSSTGLNLSTKRGSDKGIYELLDTGSTGRGTNTADKYDYDFILRSDREIIDDYTKMNELKTKIEEAFPSIKFADHNKIRDQKINIRGEEVSLDMTIIPKDDKIDYTTEECLKDRLDNIRKISPDNYKKVIENIVLAKEVLKEAGVYKPRHARENPQGGLGGVGIENWILQSGGSFERAARDFVEAADKSKDVYDFESKYIIFDFGETHLYDKNRDNFKHNEFISNNMNEAGYEKTVAALKKYLSEKYENTIKI